MNAALDTMAAALSAPAEESTNDAGNASPASDGAGTGGEHKAEHPPVSGADAVPSGQPAAGVGEKVSDGAAGDGSGSTAEAGKPGDKPDAAVTKEEQRSVPIAALHEARDQIKAMRAKIAELEARPTLTDAQRTQLERLTKAESDATAAAQAAEDKIPDFLEDPKGYVDKTLAKVNKAVDALSTADKQRQEQEAQARQFQQDMGQVGQAEQEFVKATPDYHDALSHMRNVRAAQLALMYPTATQQQILAVIGREEVNGALTALKAGVNPAEMAYKYAATMGYVKKAPASANGAAPAAANGNGAAAPAIEKDAARSLGSGGGGTLVEEDSNELAPPEFGAALAERFGVKKRKN